MSWKSQVSIRRTTARQSFPIFAIDTAGMRNYYGYMERARELENVYREVPPCRVCNEVINGAPMIFGGKEPCADGNIGICRECCPEVRCAESSDDAICEVCNESEHGSGHHHGSPACAARTCGHHETEVTP